jgi:DNA-binding transcriptional LysR family regulator
VSLLRPQPVELRELRVFLVLADELHFGRTAARLGISTSRVSQTVAMLERRGGSALFHRTSRSVALTADGQRLRDAVEPHYTALLRALASASDDVGSRLRIGLIVSASGGTGFAETVRRFDAEHPGCRVEIVDVGMIDPIAPLESGEVDLVPVRLPFARPGIELGPVVDEDPRVIMMSRHDPLAGEASVSWEVLGDRPTTRITGIADEVREAVVPSTTPAGRPVRVGQVFDVHRAVVELVNAVALGAVVHPTVASMAEHLRHPDIVYVPVHDAPPSRSAYARVAGRRSAAAEAFVALARAVHEERGAR